METISPLSSSFIFWQPPTGHTVETGADSVEFVLPQIPLPISGSLDNEEIPSDNLIGSGLYDYLRQFPDCPLNSAYAALLRDAWPHYISDLASMIVMLDHKEVDAPYVRRKIAGLQILLLLEPDNPGLQQQLGMAFYDLALNFVELCDCRAHLTRSMQYFSTALDLSPDDPTSLNYLAQIDYLIGDYPKAVSRWQALLALITDAETTTALSSRIESISGDELPEHPLLSDLESVGESMQFLANGAPEEARRILETLEEQQLLITEFPNPEFYSLLAVSRERTNDPDGARIAYTKALEIDPSHQNAIDGFERLLQGGKQCQTE